mmetsp:Transcript_124598/g.363810  ORF Transcript_124598/g.363810 Transcript_124598/m.363810 type:complete len:310 (+) Transcript_124598:396-1325(+)
MASAKPERPREWQSRIIVCTFSLSCWRAASHNASTRHSANQGRRQPTPWPSSGVAASRPAAAAGVTCTAAARRTAAPAVGVASRAPWPEELEELEAASSPASAPGAPRGGGSSGVGLRSGAARPAPKPALEAAGALSWLRSASPTSCRAARPRSSSSTEVKRFMRAVAELGERGESSEPSSARARSGQRPLRAGELRSSTSSALAAKAAKARRSSGLALPFRRTARGRPEASSEESSSQAATASSPARCMASVTSRQAAQASSSSECQKPLRRSRERRSRWRPASPDPASRSSSASLAAPPKVSPASRL